MTRVHSKTNKRILIVDDDDGILSALEAMLSFAGYTVETSSNGEVLEKLNKNNLPDAILLDVLLSGKDGRELCKLVKSRKDTKKVPIIMTSAHPLIKSKIKAYGADEFIPKPFEIEEMLNTIKKHVGS